MDDKINRSPKKTLNRNPFNEKLIHRFYLEALYFFYSGIKRNNLIPSGLGPKIKASNLKLVVPEDSRNTNESGYRQDFSLYFKDYEKLIPVEIKWTSSDFKDKHQIDYIKNNNGFLVVLKKDIEVDVPCVEIKYEDFQEWMAQRIFTLTSDSLASKGISDESSNKWLVALRTQQPLENFKRMMKATKPHFWAFKNSSYVTNQIFDLHKNDKMIFLFYKSSSDSQALKKDISERNITIFGWAEVEITDPYYICLDGEQAEFFEQIRYSPNSNENIILSDRQWVHFIDFNLLHHRFGINTQTKVKGALNNSLVESSNNGGVLTPIPQNVYNTISGIIKTPTTYENT